MIWETGDPGLLSELRIPRATIRSWFSRWIGGWPVVSGRGRDGRLQSDTMTTRLLILACCCLAGWLHVTAAVAQTSAPALPEFALTAAEQVWLDRHPVIRVAPDPNFAPIEWFNLQGDYSGVTADYLKLLEQRLGIRFEVVRGESWNDILAMARNREVDALTAIIRTEHREAYLSFTKPYFIVKRAIFATRELTNIRTLADLQGYKIAVVKGSWMDEQLSPRPGMSINRFQDLTTALLATSRGVTDVVGSALDTSAFLRRREGLLNLRPVAELAEKIELSIGVRSDWAPLTGILDKALASIGAEETATIRATWLEVDEPYFWEQPVYRYTALGLLALLLTSMVLVLVWNRMLNARVQKRSKQLEAAQMQLIQAEKMESIGRLSAGVAHEVKNPLAIIQMGSDYLAQVLSSDDTAREVLNDIDDAVRRADTVVKGLLDFSHSDDLVLKPGNVNEITAESLRLVAHEMRQRNIEVSEDLAAGNFEIDVDANKLQQVLINVLMNAAHAIDRDGNIWISCEIRQFDGNVETKAFKAGDRVLAVRIRDSGPGISDVDQAKLFDPFFTTKPVGEGTGLGLSVSRNIIELHRGALDIRNAPEGGAMVTLYFQRKADEKE
jgi:signal transduction histidine kinase